MINNEEGEVNGWDYYNNEDEIMIDKRCTAIQKKDHLIDTSVYLDFDSFMNKLGGNSE
jgi:hypothetical protein